jgi:hypothetical protein
MSRARSEVFFRRRLNFFPKTMVICLPAGWGFFDSSPICCLAGIAAFLAKTRNVTAKQAFACGRVGDIKEACSEYGLKIRVLHEPEEDNLAYTAIRRYQSDNHELLDLLANDPWSTVTDAKDVVGMFGPWPRRT